MNTIKDLKVALYSALMRQSVKYMTESEVNIAYELSQDPDIQDLLERRIDRGNLERHDDTK